MDSASSTHRSFGNLIKILVRRPRHRCEDSIRMDLRGKKWDFWTGLMWLWLGASGDLV